jgi:hypothetical protein
LQAAPALTMKFSLNMAVDDNAVGQTLALDLDRDFGTRNQALIVNVKDIRQYRNLNFFGRPGTPQHLEGVDQKWVSHRPEVLS